MSSVWTKSNTKAILLSSWRKVVAPKEGKTMNGNDIAKAIQAIKVSIDATNEEETQLIADLHKAILLLQKVGA
jgi:ribosome maturation protein Sdo1